MDKKVVEFYGLGGQLGFRGLHRLTPFQKRTLPVFRDTDRDAITPTPARTARIGDPDAEQVRDVSA
jgi:hypothetical protein